MAERFYHSGPLKLGSAFLEGTEAQHLSQVMRLGPNDRVALFDGAGTVAQAEVVSASRKRVELRVAAIETFPQPATRLRLAVAVPKGDRFRWLIEKATELGVDRFVPLLTARSVVDPRDGKLDKLRQTMIAACKQCERPHLMHIEQPTSLADLLLQNASEPRGKLILLDPRSKQPASVCSPASESTTCVIGPEGGFTEREIAEIIAAGGQAIRIADRTLRTETAAIAVAALAAAGWLSSTDREITEP